MDKCSCGHYHCHIFYNQAEDDDINITCTICGTMISIEEFRKMKFESITVDEMYKLYK